MREAVKEKSYSKINEMTTNRKIINRGLAMNGWSHTEYYCNTKQAHRYV